jgi:bifunctional enzyme CysN/CysC
MSACKFLLRIVTTGSVDDGKSTLMGRLLYETRSIFDDQLDAISKTSTRRGQSEVDLSLLLDGLAAEREQAITIDVAYRYFETAARKFILADCPGHAQYTRNMVTGASNADCAIVLIDARHGLVTQSKRHAFLLSLLQVRHVVVVVNKMDLVGYAQEVFDRIVESYLEFSKKLDIPDLMFIPASALKGDNVTQASPAMPWWKGPTLLQYLEGVQVQAKHNPVDFRFPVQYVIRPDGSFRGFAGRIASGTIRPGDEIAVLPSARTSTVKAITSFDGPLAEASAPQSVVVTLQDEIDVSRGCMLVRRKNLPQVGHRVEAILFWMDETSMKTGTPYLLKHTTNTSRAAVSEIVYRFDVDTLHRQSAATLELNDIAKVQLQTSLPIFFDPYKLNRSTGSFILIDPISNRTVGAGLILGATTTLHEISGEKPSASGRSPHTVPSPWNIPRETREARNGHKAAVIWLTGHSGAGKTTIGRRLESVLHAAGCQTMLLDGDQLRQGLCGDLGFSLADRSENIRRAGEVARLFFESGHIVICCFISPIARDRAFVRSLIPEGRFHEAHVDCPLQVCIDRDPNGLYREAIKGEIKDFTGIASRYEPPAHPELRLRTDAESVEDLVNVVLGHLASAGIITYPSTASVSLLKPK